MIEKGKSTWNEAYNIAMEEYFSLANILLRLRNLLEVADVVGDSEESEESFYNYPTVMSGNIDISKARKKLGFEPTQADAAFSQTIEFYKDAFLRFPEHRDEVLTQMFQAILIFRTTKAFKEYKAKGNLTSILCRR